LTGNKAILEKHIIYLLPLGNNYYEWKNSTDNRNLVFNAEIVKNLNTFVGNFLNKYYVIPCPGENVLNVLSCFLDGSMWSL